MVATDSPTFPHAEYRANRTVVPSRHELDSATLTVFVGLYNGVEYWDGLIEQIESQTGSGYRWLLVDNASSDETWTLISAWVATSPLDVTLVRSDFNLGSTGSVFVHFDLVTTTWGAFMHQDDVYLPDHFLTIEEFASAAPSDAVCLFSDMGRVSHDGKPLGSYPAPIWMVPDLEPATLFLALIRNHCIPWPTLTVRADVFREMEGSWHSTAGPDTEVTLRLIARGSFIHIPKETMRYRDNTSSESRSIDDRERRFGMTMTLLRIFASPEFASIALDLEAEERSAFALGIESSIRARMGDSEKATIAITAAFERLDKLWDNTEPTVLSRLSQTYGDVGAGATASLLDRMSTAAGGTAEPAIVRPLVTGMDDGSLALEEPMRSVPGLVTRIYEKVGHMIPYPARRLVARKVITAVTRNEPLSAWRFTWR